MPKKKKEMYIILLLFAEKIFGNRYRFNHEDIDIQSYEK